MKLCAGTTTLVGPYKCKSWNRTKCKEFLNTKPVVGVNSIRFLLRDEDLFNDATKQSNDESKSTQDLSLENRVDSWCGIEPWLRSCHCMLEEEVLKAFMNMHKKKEKVQMVAILCHEENPFLSLVQANAMTQPLNHVQIFTLICMMISLLVLLCLIMKIVFFL